MALKIIINDCVLIGPLMKYDEENEEVEGCDNNRGFVGQCVVLYGTRYLSLVYLRHNMQQMIYVTGLNCLNHLQYVRDRATLMLNSL
jgi:hypothetical protein